MELKNTSNNYASGDERPQPSRAKIFGYALINGFGSSVLRLGLVGLAITTACVLTFGSPDTTKTALRDSGAYSQAADKLAERAGQEATQAAGPSLESASVDSAAKASISAEMIQRDTEGAINTTYDWLQGDTQQLKLSVNLKPYIDSFTNSLGDQAVRKAEGLPTCTNEQLRHIDPNNIDVFNLPCRPPSLDLNTIKGQAITRLTSSNELLSKSVIDTTSLPKDDQGKTALDRTAYIPQVFQLTMLLPWICGGMILLGTAILAWLSRTDWRTAFHKLSRILLSSGITVLVFVAIAKFLLWFTTKPDGPFKKALEGDFSGVVVSFARSLERAYDGKLLVFGVIYAALGIAGVVTLRLLKRSAAQGSTDINKRSPEAVSAMPDKTITPPSQPSKQI